MQVTLHTYPTCSTAIHPFRSHSGNRALRDERSPLNHYGLGVKSRSVAEAKLRILGLALVGSLALIVPIAAHSASQRSNTGQAMTGPTHSGLMQVGDGHASNWSPAPGGGGGGWHPPHWGPSRLNGGPYGGAAV